MKSFFDFSIKQSDGLGFPLFGAVHSGWIVCAAAFIFIMCRIFGYAGTRGRAALKYALASLSLFLELLTAGFLIASGSYGIYSLPLHLCSLAVYLSFFHCIRGGTLLGEFLYAFCMPGAAFALVFPDWSYYPPLHIITLSSFILHILLAAYPAMLVCGAEIRPRPENCPKMLGIMLLTALPVYFFNLRFGTNYMFLSYPSPGSPLEWFGFLGRPGYILGYLPILAVVWLVLYLPFCGRK